ncbi:T-cell immunomodulatory protein-like [Varroa jacobsoni]|uniref:T-cell immunomodulatory protein-like n=1 Tax=Varroa jacobsoni TaxID=62625 RepID=UPI000BF50350|nr:T-cell immunomodulatory protein-like [Varroa jacobsoni]
MLMRSFSLKVLGALLIFVPLMSHFSDGVRDSFVNVGNRTFFNRSGYLAAFADFNSDKLIDVFVLVAPDSPSKGFRSLEVNIALQSRFQDEKYTRYVLLPDFPSRITSVIPGDLNGDRIVDIIVYSREARTITIFWGTGQFFDLPLNFSDYINITDVYVEPLLFDYNGDHVVDILTSLGDARQRTVLQCISGVQGINQCIRGNLNSSEGDKLPEIVSPHSNSFVDLNGDLNPDLLISTQHFFEIWLWRAPAVWEKGPNRPYPEGRTAAVVGQSTFVDFASIGQLLHIVQFCSALCDLVYIWIGKNSSNLDNTGNGYWKVLYQLHNGETFWKDALYERTVNAMMAFRSADVDQDGYPDFMTIVNLISGNRAVVGFRNRKCSNNKDSICVEGRQLEGYTNIGDVAAVLQVTNVGFFDLQEDGKLDVLLTTGSLQHTDWQFEALRNNYVEDVCFIKVVVASGLCSKRQCAGVGDTIEYGYNQPGPMARYEIVTSDSSKHVSIAAQLYQTGHGSLQLPYIVFGLGLSPNFVETLLIRMPGLASGHQWIQIIPNSQILVIPYPARDPSEWQTKIFIKPSKKMLYTVFAFCGIVCVNLLVVMLLHLLEKKADRLERQQQAHRFNFDAM